MWLFVSLFGLVWFVSFSQNNSFPILSILLFYAISRNIFGDLNSTFGCRLKGGNTRKSFKWSQI